ncbi:MAG: virulence RhuM family protein [Boseongicola sp.]|nr:virulence RhuM family protein [Boseongicola sp.]
MSVGYRVNTRRGVRFRQWATRSLHGHLVQGFKGARQRRRSPWLHPTWRNAG